MKHRMNLVVSNTTLHNGVSRSQRLHILIIVNFKKRQTVATHLLDRVRDHGRRPFFFREDHLETHRAASSVRFHELSSLKGSRGAGQYTCTGKTSFIASASLEM